MSWICSEEFTISPDRLRAAGGTLWEKYGKKRTYLNRNDLAEVAKFEYSAFNSGNICRASLDGEKISNSKARGLREAFRCNFFYDHIKRKLFTDSGSYWALDLIKEGVQASGN